MHRAPLSPFESSTAFHPPPPNLPREPVKYCLPGCVVQPPVTRSVPWVASAAVVWQSSQSRQNAARPGDYCTSLPLTELLSVICTS